VPQGFDRRVGNPQVPAAWHSGWPASRSTSNPHPQVPGQQRNNHVVSHLHVGSYLSAVSLSNFAFLLIELVISFQLRDFYSLHGSEQKQLVKRTYITPQAHTASVSTLCVQRRPLLSPRSQTLACNHTAIRTLVGRLMVSTYVIHVII